ncbi:mechanosensitive ion channel domain-containing protein [Thalassoporum mexicanum]|uniref:mechanosensitive ion channel domain-containing protein n=1 Tax=Thalassoporum mexicanum TaxID=3457544 RepID=UPI0005A098E4|nr:mechanosensitive ion channel domain-containing protein [Pseudanabaena sp. PCC 7367]
MRPFIIIFLILMPLLSSIWLGSPLFIAPGQAQVLGGEDSTATVVLDGSAVLEVRSLDRFPANTRARQANAVLSQELQEALQQRSESSQEVPIEVTVEPQDNLYTIQVNGTHLLTVTERDSGEDQSTLIHALVWKRKIEIAYAQAIWQRSNEYRRQALFIAIIVTIVAVLACWALQYLNKKGFGLLPRRFRVFIDSSKSARSLFSLVMFLAQTAICLGTVYYISELSPFLRSWRYRIFTFVITDTLTYPVLNLGESAYSIADILILFVMIVVLWISVRAITKLLRNRFISNDSVDYRFQETLTTLSQYLLTFIGLVIILQIWGLDLSSLAILASVLGVGIGLGLQNIAKDFVSGIIILFDRSIQIGDLVRVANLIGTVQHIGARSTQVLTLDQITIIVPNSQFLEQQVVNWNHGNPVTRLRVPVGVAYGSNIDGVRAAILDATKGNSEILDYPQPQVWFMGFGDSSLNFELLVWISVPKNQFRLMSDLNYKIESNFRLYGVEIPFPQRDLHVRSPQLDRIVDLVGDKLAAPEQKIYYPDRYKLIKQPIKQPSSNELKKNSEQKEQTKTVVKPGLDLETLAAKMRAPDGVEVKDRRYLFNVFERCFVGAEAVQWLMRICGMTKTEALRAGQLLIDGGYVHHVLDEHGFEDEYYFYRFFADEQGLIDRSEVVN